MQINLSEKVEVHFKRLENLAEEASIDEDESYSSRASAMGAMTNMLRDLSKTQADIVNMERMMMVERLTIEAIKKYLTPSQTEQFLTELEKVLP